MPVILSSESDDDKTGPIKLFGREKPIRELLGGGKVADVLLWKDKNVSAALLIAVAAIWFLFEVADYNVVTLLCHVFITTMLVIFIWSKGAEVFKWNRPKIPKTVLEESTFKEIASTFHAKFNKFLSTFLYIACGNDVKLFFMTLGSLLLLSLIGNYISALNLLFFGLVCMETLPYVYEKYEKEVDHTAGKLQRRITKKFKNLDLTFLEKIPRGPVKDKKAN